MKIVIDARESGTTTGRYVDKLVENLHQHKPPFEVVVLTKSPRIEYFKAVAPNFKVIRSDYKEFTFSEQLGLAWQIYKLRPDLVHFANTNQPILYFGKTVTTIHDLTTARFTNPAKSWLAFKAKQLVYKTVVNIVVRKSKALLVPTNFVKEDVAQYTRIKPGKITVTYEAADKIADTPQPVKSLKPGSFMMYVGRPLPHKNLERLVEAYQLLKHSHPELQLALVGKNDALFEKIKQKVTKEQIKGVVFTGFVSEAQLRWLYENTSAYVFPSLSEGFGLPGLEAMAHGAPVVSSNSTCLPEVYGSAALYFDPLDVSDMEIKIHEVLTDEALRQRLIKSGYTQTKKYSWQAMAKKTLQIYTQIAQKNR